MIRLKYFYCFAIKSSIIIIKTMSSNFDDSIFGQLIQPKKITNQSNLKRISKETLTLNGLQRRVVLNNNGEPSSAQANNGKYTYNRNNKRNALRTKQAEVSEKQHSNISTSIGNQNIRSSLTSSQNSRKIVPQDMFKCGNCSKSKQNKECQMCEGKGQVDGGNNIVKFIQFMVDFKLGLQQPYKRKKHQSELIQTRTSLKQMGNNYSVLTKSAIHKNVYIDFHHFKDEKSRQEKIHHNYICDICGVSPIVGVRYHCPEPQCNDDFDVCEDCYCQEGHQHELQQIAGNGIKERLINFSALLYNPTKGDRKNNKLNLFYSSVN